MKKAWAAIMLSMFTLACISQNNQISDPGSEPGTVRQTSQNWFSEIIIGMALPHEDFARSDFSENAGLARPGVFVSAAYGRNFNKRLGLQAVLSVGSNSLNKKLDSLLKRPPSTTPSYAYKYTSWNHLRILAGPVLLFPVKNSTLEFNLLCGFMTLKNPQIIQQWNSNGRSFYVAENKPGSGDGFVYQLGTSYRRRLRDKISMKISVDYFRSEPEVRYQRIAHNGYGITHFKEIKSKQPVSMFNIGAGLYFRLD